MYLKLWRCVGHITMWNCWSWTAAILPAGELAPPLATFSWCALSTFCRALNSFWRWLADSSRLVAGWSSLHFLSSPSSCLMKQRRLAGQKVRYLGKILRPQTAIGETSVAEIFQKVPVKFKLCEIAVSSQYRLVQRVWEQIFEMFAQSAIFFRAEHIALWNRSIALRSWANLHFGSDGAP